MSPELVMEHCDAQGQAAQEGGDNTPIFHHTQGTVPDPGAFLSSEQVADIPAESTAWTVSEGEAGSSVLQTNPPGMCIFRFHH